MPRRLQGNIQSGDFPLLVQAKRVAQLRRTAGERSGNQPVHQHFAGALLLIALACLNEYMTKKPLGEAAGYSQKSSQLATSHLHNAETIQAMGMLGSLRKRWFGVHSRFLGLQNQASDTGSVISSLSKSLRLLLQSLVLL